MFSINDIDRKHIKNIIIKNNLIPYKCALCDITHWNNQELSLHLDHINGINNDNHLKNLRFLCPNCHSLTESYCGKKLKGIYSEKKSCIDCGAKISKKSTRCRSCAKLNHNPIKIIWPNEQVLKDMISNFGYQGTAVQLGVSRNSVKNQINKLPIEL